MQYAFYQEMRNRLASQMRKLSGVSRKKMKRQGLDPVEVALKTFFGYPGNGMTMEAAILTDEEGYVEGGRRIYVPQDPMLVEMLWRAKMKVDLSDLMDFPNAFSVAWPRGTKVGGVELPGCLVWFGPKSERDALGMTLEKYTGRPVQMTYSNGYRSPGDELSLHVSFCKQEPNGPEVFYRASLPESWLIDCLRSADDLEHKLTLYPLGRQLSSEECRWQYAVVKSVVHLMVYATACPDSVHDGWPDMSGAKGALKKAHKVLLASPVPKTSGHQGGTHESPETHWRDWHFRSYPSRKDGTRKKGMVFVSGCLVMGNVDPKTVVKVGK